jgi:hypothetical protein
MPNSHRARVDELLSEASREHAALVERLPAEMQASVPVDAQGITRAIDELADAAGFSEDDRRALIRPHAVNPAVMHARVYGAAPLSQATVMASFVEGARVRADALGALADAVGGNDLGSEVRNLLLAHPLPAGADQADAVGELRETYQAQERAALRIAEALDARDLI